MYPFAGEEYSARVTASNSWNGLVGRMMVVVFAFAILGCQGSTSDVPAGSGDYISARPSTARTMQFDAEVDGLPPGLNIPVPSSPHRSSNSFRIYADRDKRELTVDSLDDMRRWRFSPSRATHSQGRQIEDLGDSARLLGMAVLAAAFDEFGDCSSREVSDLHRRGWTGPTPARATWREVECPWFPRDHMDKLFLSYVQYAPEPPQMARIRLWFDGEEMEIRPGRIVYDLPLPQAAMSPIQAPPEKSYVAPLRPGATTRERRDHEIEKNTLRAGD